jgi:hypothetical protein
MASKNNLVFQSAALLAAVIANGFFATDASAITITNKHPEAITVIFRAAGCAGITSGVSLSCNSQVVQSGQQIGYSFKGGTSYQQIRLKGPGNCNKNTKL